MRADRLPLNAANQNANNNHNYNNGNYNGNYSYNANNNTNNANNKGNNNGNQNAYYGNQNQQGQAGQNVYRYYNEEGAWVDGNEAMMNGNGFWGADGIWYQYDDNQPVRKSNGPVQRWKHVQSM